MRDAALALLQDTFENPAHDPRDRLLLAAGPGAAIELPESVQRSWDFGHGFAEGNGFSILQSLEALNAVVRDPGQLLSGLQALITSAEARGQLGQDILNGIRNDMQMFRDAYAAGDMRRAGQQFGKLTGDLVQLVGGVEAVARLAPGLARGAGRGASAVVDRLTDPRLASPAPGSRRAQLGAVGNLGDEVGSSVHSPPNQPANLPSGFASVEDFSRFSADLHAELARAGHTDVQPILQGSSITGRNYRTGAEFDIGRRSDFDIALASPSLMQRARELGFDLRSGGRRTGPLSETEMSRLGLANIAAAMSARYRRPVVFMLYDSVETATRRAPSLLIPRK